MLRKFENGERGISLNSDAPSGPQVVQIGFNKCGTRSLYHFFRRNGLSCAHYAQGRLGAVMALNLATGQPVLKGLGQFNALTDLQGPVIGSLFEGHMFFREIDRDHPGAKFILPVRPVEDWIQSRLTHPHYARRCRQHYDVADFDALAELWRAQWTQYRLDVERHFRKRPDDLLVFDITADGPEKIRDFLKPHYTLRPKHWKHEGQSAAASVVSLAERRTAGAI